MITERLPMNYDPEAAEFATQKYPSRNKCTCKSQSLIEAMTVSNEQRWINLVQAIKASAAKDNG